MLDFYGVHSSLYCIRLELSMLWLLLFSIKSTPASHAMLAYTVADSFLPVDQMSHTITGDMFRS